MASEIWNNEEPVKSLAEIDASFWNDDRFREPEDIVYFDFDAKIKELFGKYRSASEDSRPTNAKSRISGILFYTTLALIVLGVFFFASGPGEAGAPRNFLGYSGMTVLTRSMQSEIPEDSLVITRRVDPNTLRVGDDITFFLDESTVVTHRIVTIYHDHEGSGERAFQTQGIENSIPDHQLVIPDNIIGRVIFSNLTIGRVFTILQDNLLIGGILATMVLGLFVSMNMIFKGKQEEFEPTGQLVTA